MEVMAHPDMTEKCLTGNVKPQFKQHKRVWWLHVLVNLRHWNELDGILEVQKSVFIMFYIVFRCFNSF